MLRTPADVIEGLEMGRVSWIYPDGLLRSFREESRVIRVLESMAEDVT